MTEAATFEGIFHVLATRAPYSYAACGGSGKKMTRMKTRRRRGGPMFPKDCKACEGEGMRPFATARVFNPNPANELVTYEDKGDRCEAKEEARRGR